MITKDAKLQSIPKRNIIIVLIVVVVYVLIFTSLAFVIVQVGGITSQMSKQSLTIWKIVSIPLLLYTLSTPWRWQKRIIARANQPNLHDRQILGMLIFFCFVPFTAPLIYGLVLLFWGLSLTEFYYFAALSVVGALAWSVYNLRKN